MEEKQVTVGEYENEIDAEIAKGRSRSVRHSSIHNQRRWGWNASIVTEYARCSIAGC